MSIQITCAILFLFFHIKSIAKVSKVTHFLDASPVYGSDEKTKSEVRSFQGGRLRMLDDFGRQLLPLTTDKKTCVTQDKGPCFFAGKIKYSENHIICFGTSVGLSLTHTLFGLYILLLGLLGHLVRHTSLLLNHGH